MTATTKKTISILLKTAILLLVIWALYSKLNNHENLLAFSALIRALDTTTLVTTLTVIVLLMFVNWLIEVVKWQYLCRYIEKIGFFRSIQSVFCGLTWAVFTPNRIGEYGGRVMFLSPRKRIFGVVAMGVGALAQLVLVSIFGSLSIAWFATTYLGMTDGLAIALWIAACAYATFFAVLYFNVKWINNIISRVRMLKKTHRFFEVLTRYERRELMNVFLFSLSRFIIFTSQYCILMLIIIPGISFFPMLWMIFILFFIQSALPSLDLFDFGVRSLTASYLFTYITDQEVAVMAIVSCIWFVNLILPAILGSVFTLKINFFGTSNH